MLGIDVWAAPSRLIAQHYNHLFGPWNQDSGFAEEEEARRASLEFHLTQNLKPKRRRRPVHETAEKNQQLLTICDDNVQVITAQLKSIEVDMQAQACFSSPPATLNAPPLVYDPWASLESPVKSPHRSGFTPRHVQHWTAPNWHEGAVASNEVAGDLAEPLLTEPFDYPYEGGEWDLPDFDAAFESLSRNSELIRDATSELGQTSPTSPTQQAGHAFSTFAWTQDATSPKMWVNPRYLSRSKHTRVESAAISPRTLRRPHVPEPIVTGNVVLEPLAIRTARTLEGDAFIITGMNGAIPKTPGPLSVTQPHRIGDVEVTEVYRHCRSHSTEAVGQFSYEVEVREYGQGEVQADSYTGLL